MKVNIVAHPTRAGWYYLEFRPEGSKGKRERIPVSGYEKALTQRDAIERQYLEPSRTADTHPKIAAVYKEYLQWVESNQAAATYKAKDYIFEHHLIPHFGAYRVKELSVSLFDEFQKTLKGKRRAIILYQHTLMALIKWMQERHYAPPMTFKPNNPRYHPPKVVIPTMAEIQQVIDYVEDDNKRALLVTMLWTGLRWNEARLLRWEDVYLKQGVIRVRESEQEEEIHVQIYPEMQPWLKANRKKRGWLFPNPQTITEKLPEGNPWGSFKTLLKTANKRLGTEIDHHDFRRRSGQNVYEASGFDIFAAQRHLRHKDIRTTMRYLGVDEQRRADVVSTVVQHVAKLRKSTCPKDNSENE